MHRDEEWPSFAATRESPRTETKTRHSHKQTNKQTNPKFKKKECPEGTDGSYGEKVYFSILKND